MTGPTADYAPHGEDFDALNAALGQADLETEAMIERAIPAAVTHDLHHINFGVCYCDCPTCTTSSAVCICPDCDRERCGLHQETE